MGLVTTGPGRLLVFVGPACGDRGRCLHGGRGRNERATYGFRRLVSKRRPRSRHQSAFGKNQSPGGSGRRRGGFAKGATGAMNVEVSRAHAIAGLPAVSSPAPFSNP